uniref:Uncharacterized protein n=1 Tax=Strongyloides venezuelensis TaxID=75913 RepID=A0A0K0F3M2_STRVS
MNSKLVIALLAIFLATVSSQYYYPYGGYYGGYYNSLYGYGYPSYGYASAWPSYGYYYGYGSNKGNTGEDIKAGSQQAGQNVKLTNNF